MKTTLALAGTLAMILLVGGARASLNTVLAQPEVPQAQSTMNQVVVDVTINSAGEVSVAGMSTEQMKSVGLYSVLGADVLPVAQKLNSLHLVIQGESVTAEVNGKTLLTMNWDAQSRQAVAQLAADNGINIQPEELDRIEQWVSASNVDLTVRMSDEISKSPTVTIPMEFIADVSSDGTFSIEHIPLGNIQPDVLNMLTASGVKVSQVCFNKGTVNLNMDNSALPTIVLDQSGVDYVNQALGLTTVDLKPLFNAQVGMNVALPGGTHTPNASCDSLLSK